MTDQEINAAVAECCGFLRKTRRWKGDDRYTPPGQETFWVDQKGERVQELPNYCTDLNAMHEAEEALTYHGTLAHYQEELIRIVGRNKGPFGRAQYWVFHATARQRAEAFLRTIGKWKE